MYHVINSSPTNVMSLLSPKDIRSNTTKNITYHKQSNGFSTDVAIDVDIHIHKNVYDPIFADIK